MGVVKSVEKKKSVTAGQFAVKYKPDTYSWTQKVNRVDKYSLLL